MDDLPLQKIAISGPTLASLIQRFSSSSGDVDGLLFGHVSQPTPSNLLEDDLPEPSSTRSDSPTLVANVTGFVCSGTVSSFYDSAGRLNEPALRRFVTDRALPGQSLLGWFVGRRRTALRPSLREFNVSSSLSNETLTLTANSQIEDSVKIPPCVFILLSTPLIAQSIHTHDHRAFQFRRSSGAFEPKSMDVVNIGPGFRVHYGAFSPNSPLPWLPCVVRDSSSMEIEEDKRRDGLAARRAALKEQKGLDLYAEGFDVGRLGRLMGSEAANYTSELEGLYEKMLVKLEGLARNVEKSSAKVLEQEQRNMKLRSKFAGFG
ncbi:hypothetical protein Syun_010940 [Stephania yunnanensis]|uniref:Uncharacterized protein n=1 Tax=Stephania yunnanensis TaxID=152371 RepID=A0AAP0JYV9_9MAGN